MKPAPSDSEGQSARTSVAAAADTEEEALAQIEKLSQFADPVAALRVLSERIGHDLSSYSLDEPVPSFPPSDKMQGHAVNLARMSKKHNLTLRQLRDYASAAQGHRLIWGTPERIADQLQEWFDADAADGFVVMPAYFPGAFDAFVDRVIPILQKRGLSEPSMNPLHFVDIWACHAPFTRRRRHSMPVSRPREAEEPRFRVSPKPGLIAFEVYP
jgi:alkanesulfonate monooxygenase SsuD/methylene tetrahydromethanopterin reductase-like flavin-dependent oxidoreductase (luciferase family)